MQNVKLNNNIQEIIDTVRNSMKIGKSCLHGGYGGKFELKVIHNIRIGTLCFLDDLPDLYLCARMTSQGTNLVNMRTGKCLLDINYINGNTDYIPRAFLATHAGSPNIKEVIGTIEWKI